MKFSKLCDEELAEILSQYGFRQVEKQDGPGLLSEVIYQNSTVQLAVYLDAREIMVDIYFGQITGTGDVRKYQSNLWSMAKAMGIPEDLLPTYPTRYMERTWRVQQSIRNMLKQYAAILHDHCQAILLGDISQIEQNTLPRVRYVKSNKTR